MEMKEMSTLYLEWAIEHMAKIDLAIQSLSVSNINLLPIIGAMQEERQKLINENPNYEKAAEILDKLKTLGFNKSNF